MDSLNGEEKKDASKEDLEQEEGSFDLTLEIYITLRKFFEKLERKIERDNRERETFIMNFFKN